LKQRRGDIRAIREADSHWRADPIGVTGLRNEVGELVGAATQILFVEHTLGETAEEARHLAFEYPAPRRQQSGAWSDGTTKRQKIALVAARTVQEEDGSLARNGRRHEPVKM
jgi:hypothetical protein